MENREIAAVFEEIANLMQDSPGRSQVELQGGGL